MSKENGLFSSIHNLRKNGYKIRVIHHRKYLVANEPFEKPKEICLSNFEKQAFSHKYYKILQNGGFTELQILTPDKKEYIVTSNCSKKDNYCRKRGVIIALGRLAKNLNN